MYWQLLAGQLGVAGAGGTLQSHPWGKRTAQHPAFSIQHRTSSVPHLAWRQTTDIRSIPTMKVLLAGGGSEKRSNGDSSATLSHRDPSWGAPSAPSVASRLRSAAEAQSFRINSCRSQGGQSISVGSAHPKSNISSLNFDQNFIYFFMPHSGFHFLRFWCDLVPKSSILGAPWRPAGPKMAPKIAQVAEKWSGAMCRL